MPVSVTFRSFSNAMSAIGPSPPTGPVRGIWPRWLLGRAPPGLVLDVPVDRLLEPLGEVGVRRLQPSSRWSFVLSMA